MKIKDAFKTTKEEFTQVGQQSPGILDDFAERKSNVVKELIIEDYLKFAHVDEELLYDRRIILRDKNNLGYGYSLSSNELGNSYFAPNTTGVGSLGTSVYHWGLGYINYLYCDELNIDATSGTYKFVDDGLHIGYMNTTSGQQTCLNFYTADGDGTVGSAMRIYGVGTYDDHATNYESIEIRYAASTSNILIRSQAGGTGTVRPIYILTGSNSTQLVLAINGKVGVGKEPTTYALEVSGEIQPTSGYRSTDGTAGLTATKSFRDETAGVTNTVTIKNGLITAWSQC